MPVPAQVRGFPGDNHKVSRPGQDLLVAAGANVRLAGLRGADAAELDVARLVGRGQVDQVLQFLQAATGMVRAGALATSGGPSYHGRQVSPRRHWYCPTTEPVRVVGPVRDEERDL
jgi:hypothetical protein